MQKLKTPDDLLEKLDAILFEELSKKERIDRLVVQVKDMAEVLQFYAMVNGSFYDRARDCLKRNFGDLG